MPASAYRPFVSTDATVADTGDVELEFGAIGFRSDGGAKSIVAPDVIARVRAVAEVNGESATGAGPDDSALIGAIWEVKAPAPIHGLAFDIGLRHGITHDAAEWGGTAGFTVGFPFRKKEEP